MGKINFKAYIVRAIKNLILGLMAFTLTVVVHRIVMGIFYPIGGGEFHAVFAYAEYGRINTAGLVFKHPSS